MSLELLKTLQTAAVVIVSLLFYVLARRAGARYVRTATEEDAEKGARAATLWLMVRRVILVSLFSLVVLVIFSIWGISMAPFVAFGAVIAAAIGFGAQDLVKDILAGFFLLAEDQYRIGDTVTIAGTTGTVTDIQFRVTVLRDFEGKVHFVPNGKIEVATNYTDVFAQPVIDVGIAYKEDVDRAMEVMLEELHSLEKDPEWGEKIRGPAEFFGVQELGDSSVVIRGRVTTDADERWTVRREAFRRIKNRFDAEGIEIPFPHVTVYYGDT
jgi:small conductance mechanosensitive channel